MCYDISFTVNLKEIGDYFPELLTHEQGKIDFQLKDHIQGHAHAEHPVIYRSREDAEIHMKLMEWGIIPHYIKDKEKYKPQRRTMLNIRSERILDDTSSYWYKIRNKRCLVPMTGFYEHNDVAGWKKKVPYYIRLKDQKIFFVPGLYAVADLVVKGTGELVRQYTSAFVTREANTDMKLIHNCGENAGRMPLMLPFELSQAWLNSDLSDNDYREILNYEMSSEELDYRTVYTVRTQNPRPGNLDKTSFYEWPNLPPLKAV